MKLKYYLRGLGIGIIVTTVILVVRFSFYKPEITDDEVMARAAQLGMVMPEENMIAEDTQAKETKEKQENTEDVETVPETEESMETTVTEEPGNVAFVVNPGDVCRTVCDNLFEAGLIEDASVFETFLAGKRFSDSIIAGTYEIPYGVSYEEVYQILRGGPW